MEHNAAEDVGKQGYVEVIVFSFFGRVFSSLLKCELSALVSF